LRRGRRGRVYWRERKLKENKKENRNEEYV
jgi:hypothetical protein